MRSRRYTDSVMLASLIGMLCCVSPLTANAAVDERTFHRILDLAERVYTGDFLAQNLRLQLHRDWQDDAHRASASRQEDRYGIIAVVRISGGIARDPNITRDAFTLIVCHEIGHHLAGSPQRFGFSAEGQADYFGASECLRRLLPLVPDYAATAMVPIPRQLEAQCNRAYADADEAYLCLRIAVAGESLSRYFASRKGGPEPHFLARDTRTVEQTRFPSATPQCRLDTYRAAALCNPAANRDRTLQQRWLCDDGAPPIALRPTCWYGG